MSSHDDHMRHIDEAHKVIEQIARFQQSDATGLYHFGPVERLAHKARVDKARDLIALIKAHIGETDLWDLDEHVERWIAAHPLSLTGAIIKAIIDKGPNKGNGEQVAIQIGTPGDGGHFYLLHAHQFERDSRTGALRVVLPDSVAEEFRQAGRRAVQREFASLMALTTDA